MGCTARLEATHKAASLALSKCILPARIQSRLHSAFTSIGGFCPKRSRTTSNASMDLHKITEQLQAQADVIVAAEAAAHVSVEVTG